MGRAAMTSLVLAMLVALFTSGGDACAGVRAMTWNETCLAACPTSALYDLCRETLQNAAAPGSKAEVTVYAIVAARRVARSYDDTVDAAERLIVAGSGGDEREALQRCIGSYGTARAEMGGVVTDMAGCEFARTEREYGVAAAAVAECGEVLKTGSPLLPKNASDRDLTAVAADLGAMVIGKE